MSHVLVVDDDSAVRAAIKILLETEGFEVSLAEDGRSGMEAMRTMSIDLVLVDIFMPGLDGFDTIKSFRKSNPDVPIIAMSGFMFRDSMSGAPDFLAMATKLGAAGSLRKPFKPRELMQTVTTCLESPPRGRDDVAMPA